MKRVLTVDTSQPTKQTDLWQFFDRRYRTKEKQ